MHFNKKRWRSIYLIEKWLIWIMSLLVQQGTHTHTPLTQCDVTHTGLARWWKWATVNLTPSLLKIERWHEGRQIEHPLEGLQSCIPETNWLSLFKEKKINYSNEIHLEWTFLYLNIYSINTNTILNPKTWPLFSIIVQTCFLIYSTYKMFLFFIFIYV